MKIVFILSYLSCILLVLTSASELLNNFQKYLHRRTKTKPDFKNSSILLNLGDVEKSEAWKEQEFENWMKETEVDWIKFTEQMEELTTSWFEKKEEEWEGWIKAMESKWSYYNKNMGDKCIHEIFKNSLNWDDEKWEKWLRIVKKKSVSHTDNSDEDYIRNVFKKSLKWTDSQWIEWINTPVRRAMEKDWENWVAEDQYKLDKWISENFYKWVNRKLKEWKSRHWKQDEDKYWTELENDENLEYSSNTSTRMEWKKWKHRNERETERWNEWIDKLKNEYFNREVIQWTAWKSNKCYLFNHWMKTLIDNWIHDKQWNVWLYKNSGLNNRKRRWM
ncbi:tryptophan-rich protein [Plasmodium ovale]|nr:tryptophan-rich protein [Plasmodium ovale]